MEVGLRPSHIVLDGDPAPLPQKGTKSPNFRSIFVVVKRLDGSRWHLVWRQASTQATLCSMGTQLPQNRGQCTHHHPVFGPCSLWPNGWMAEDASWYGSRPQPTPHCIRRGPSSPRNGHSSPHLFGPCLLWPRSPSSATAELLLWPSYVIGGPLYFCAVVCYGRPM